MSLQNKSATMKSLISVFISMSVFFLEDLKALCCRAFPGIKTCTMSHQCSTFSGPTKTLLHLPAGGRGSGVTRLRGDSDSEAQRHER